jgi:enoyl-CoA hydratase/carnithine racemase
MQDSDSESTPRARSPLQINKNTNGNADVVQVELVDADDRGSLTALVYLNRPESLNAISWDMVKALEVVLAELEANHRVRTVLITGRGRGFSAGGDLKAYLELQQDPKAFPQFMDDLMRGFGSIRDMRMPVVALVNGVTVAGGIELMLACDFTYAAESARIGDGHLNFGQMGGGGALSLLPRAIGPSKARELMFSAELLNAQTALEWGLVNRIFPDDELLEAGLAFGRGVATRAASAIAGAKYVMNTGMSEGTGLHASMRLERERTALYCLTNGDSREGLLAFSEKRRPRFATPAADPSGNGSA